jgi:hypothetical protein
LLEAGLHGTERGLGQAATRMSRSCLGRNVAQRGRRRGSVRCL